MRPPSRLALLTFAVAFPTVAAAQTPAFVPETAATIGAPRTMVTADFNRDGYPDVALGGTGRDSIGFLFNTGAEESDMHLQPGPDVVVGGGPFDMATGDLNRDGKMDLAIANADADAITLLIGNGDGTFQAPRHIAAAGNPRGITLADLNRDGILDIAFSLYTAATWRVAYGDGAGNFGSVRSFATAANPQGLVAGDYNNDGWTDVAVALASGKVSVYLLGATTFTRDDITGPNTPWNVMTSGDFNHDGLIDLAAASSANQVVGLFRGAAGGSFTYYASALTEWSPRGIDAADVNHDGWIDLVTGDRGVSRVSVLIARKDGSGTFTSYHVTAGNGARDVAIADFTGDGRLDIATANEFDNSSTLLINTTNLGPAPAFRFERLEIGFQPDPLEDVADFNHNGKPDLLYRSVVLLDGTTRVNVQADRYTHVESNAAGDFNRDGHADVIAAVGGGLRLYAGDGAGNFSPGALMGGGTSETWELRTTDLDRDGRLDIVGIARNYTTKAGTVIAFRGRGDGTFDALPPASLAAQANDLELADVNRDTIPDAVVPTPAGVYVLLGNGNGTWKPAVIFEDGTPRWGVAAGDVTGDGILDLVMTDMQVFTWGTSWGPIVTVARGHGDGTFERLAQYDTGDPGYAYTLTLGDFDADGELDIFTSTGHFMRGLGNGQFAAPERFAPQTFRGIRALDFNRDGLLDLAGYQDYDVCGCTIVMLNTRTAPSANRPPTGLTDFTTVNWRYGDYWYGEDEYGVWAGQVTDPDLHAVRYRWTLADGTLLSTYNSWGPGPDMLPGTYQVTITVDDYHGASISDTFTFVMHPLKEVVIAAWNAELHGAWQQVDTDTTANSEWWPVKVWHPNANAPKVPQALPSPTNYVEFGFIADPTQTYKLWLRLKAENNSWANDSVYVQFSGATDAAGNPIYQVGTSSALAVNLEECAGCGVSGWGWEDDGWGAVNRNGVTLRFPEGGPQLIRIQTREDGVQFDQIVLSSEKYLTTRPGTAKNDNTRLGQVGPELGTWWFYNR